VKLTCVQPRRRRRAKTRGQDLKLRPPGYQWPTRSGLMRSASASARSQQSLSAVRESARCQREVGMKVKLRSWGVSKPRFYLQIGSIQGERGFGTPHLYRAFSSRVSRVSSCVPVLNFLASTGTQALALPAGWGPATRGRSRASSRPPAACAGRRRRRGPRRRAGRRHSRRPAPRASRASRRGRRTSRTSE
jgi:hypothetical protein